MKSYVVTPLAGPFVAGRRNAGTGETLTLSDREAAHDLRLGALVLKAPSPRRTRRKENDEGADA